MCFCRRTFMMRPGLGSFKPAIARVSSFSICPSLLCCCLYHAGVPRFLSSESPGPKPRCHYCCSIPCAASLPMIVLAGENESHQAPRKKRKRTSASKLRREGTIVSSPPTNQKHVQLGHQGFPPRIPHESAGRRLLHHETTFEKPYQPAQQNAAAAEQVTFLRLIWDRYFAIMCGCCGIQKQPNKLRATELRQRVCDPHCQMELLGCAATSRHSCLRMKCRLSPATQRSPAGWYLAEPRSLASVWTSETYGTNFSAVAKI